MTAPPDQGTKDSPFFVHASGAYCRLGCDAEVIVNSIFVPAILWTVVVAVALLAAWAAVVHFTHWPGLDLWGV